MGKRQLGELQPAELVTTIMMSNIAAIPIENTDMPLSTVIASIALLACLEVLVSALLLKSRGLRRLAVGSPRMVVQDGHIQQQELRDLRWSIDDLMEQLRTSGIFDLSEVAYAVVETNGDLSVLPRYSARPKPNQPSPPAPEEGDAPPAIVISDGQVVPTALEHCRLNEQWLQRTLEQEKKSAEDIFLMSCWRGGRYHIVLKEEQQ